MWWPRAGTRHLMTKTGLKGNHQGQSQAFLDTKIILLLGKWQPDFHQKASLSFLSSPWSHPTQTGKP